MSAVFWRLLDMAARARRLSMEPVSLDDRAKFIKFARECDERAGGLIRLELKAIALATKTTLGKRTDRSP